ncbi:hypothetical protein SPRG_02712 [Saprolegnia parasitica CBS 223.65]|uniref:Uncharacterized protein n=1 Tax=Saprolegnia parasitica (strain CBS 223.65) TaxID=695850 RepID=A0A067CNI8_SAPPC|nr:hypothetical protein SPRG_02712 [Saprolegnia parasitica CBS 223.65]KDO32234.1 hypothetical protein SPRG_02712 [Saprolegnia parasitica CBS 223.65]|eukprot:XP_012196692.1 hypothetical protein SPRG_02712 [Saprolegnia parasitica CBS 223.65]
MSDAKMTDDEEHLTQLPKVDVLRVDISPNPTHISDELNLEVDFSVSKTVRQGYWEVQYLVDSVLRRHIIKLGRTDATDYTRGENHFQFSVSHIDVSGIKPSNLANCGLLSATFKSEDGDDILDLKMVVQVSKQGESMQRIIYNPLE